MSMFHELMMRKKEEIMYATIKGTLTENPEGVFSGFAYNNYLATQEVLDTSKNFEIVLKMNTGNISVNTNLRIIARNNFGSSAGTTGFAFGINGSNKKIQSYIIDSSGILFVDGILGMTVFDNNTDYFFKFSQKLNNGTYTIKIESSTDGTNWTTENSWTHNLPIRSSGQGIAFGGGALTQINQYWAGSIDIPNSYIKLGSTKYNLQAVVGYTIVGSLTESPSGVFSGFSSSNYLEVNYTPQNINNYELGVKFTLGNSVSSTQTIIGQKSTNVHTPQLAIDSSRKLYFSFPNASHSWVSVNTTYALNIDTTYEAKMIWTGNKVYAYLKSNSVWELIGESDLATNGWDEPILIGLDTGLNAWGGSIDLNETYIKVNNKLWFNGQQA